MGPTPVTAVDFAYRCPGDVEFGQERGGTDAGDHVHDVISVERGRHQNHRGRFGVRRYRELLCELEAVLLAKNDIDKCHVGPELIVQTERFGTCRGDADDRDSCSSEQITDHPAEVIVVVDDEASYRRGSDAMVMDAVLQPPASPSLFGVGEECLVARAAGGG